MKTDILQRFLRYVSIDTQSDDTATTYPSTEKQRDLGRLLIEELKELGLKDVTVDEFGYIMATLPSNVSHKVPVIGFLAHMDTSPDMSGANIKPQIIENYKGDDIVLNKESKLTMTTREFPELKQYVGQTIITTDGTTLLGADDKAGIAEIMTAVDYLIKHQEIKHGDIRIGFTHDEEVGHGVDHFYFFCDNINQIKTRFGKQNRQRYSWKTTSSAHIQNISSWLKLVYFSNS